MEKIKVLLVIDHLGGGGAENQFLKLAKGIDRKLFEIKIFLTEGGGEKLNEALSHGLDIEFQRLDRKRNTLITLRRLYKTIREFNPDIVMAWLMYSIAITALVLTITGKRKFIASERSSLEYLFNKEVRFGKLKKILLKIAFKKANYVVTNSRFVSEEFISFGYARLNQIKITYNGIDLIRFNTLKSKLELREKLRLNLNTLYGIFVGRLEYRKGVTFLIDALNEVYIPDFEVIVLGRGSLEDLVKKHTRVKYLGYKKNTIEYIKASDFLLLPAIYEGMPNVILEAMAVGTPVISTNVSGIPELIENNVNGLLIPAGDKNSLRKAILKLINDRELRELFAKESLNKVHSFSIERMIKDYETLFRSLSGEDITLHL